MYIGGRMLKRIATIFLVSFTLFAFLSTSPQKAHAEYEISIGPFRLGTGLLGDAINVGLGVAGEHLTKFAADSVEQIINSATVAISGIDCPPDNVECDQIVMNNPYLDGGLAGEMGDLAYDLFENTPRIDTVGVGKTMFARNILGIGIAQAQGVSYFQSPNAIQVETIWFVARNIAYLFFVLILMIFGLMILFRYQLDPRTVVTIQSAIPRVTIGLVLVTFSLPISGLMLDAGLLAKELVYNAFTPAVTTGLRELDLLTIDDTFDEAAKAVVGTLSGGGDILSTIAAFIISVGGAIVAFLILFEIVKRLGMIFILAMFSPLVFMWGTLPGQGDTIKRWFSGMLTAVLSIPFMYLLTSLARYFGGSATGVWGRPDIAMPTDLGLAYGAGTHMNGILAVAFLAIAAKAPAILDDVLAVKEVRGGVDVGKAMKKVPVVGKFL